MMIRYKGLLISTGVENLNTFFGPDPTIFVIYKLIIVIGSGNLFYFNTIY